MGLQRFTEGSHDEQVDFYFMVYEGNLLSKCLAFELCDLDATVTRRFFCRYCTSRNSG